MRYGFAIVGCGGIGRVHAAAVADLPGADLVTAVDSDPARAKRLAGEFGARPETDLDRALSDPDVDVVCVCVPSGLHAGVGVRAARAGKHVVVEKPIDVQLAAADALLAACHDAQVALMPVFQLRYAPGVRQVRQLVGAGRLGKPVLAEVAMPWFRPESYYQGAGWRGSPELDGGGCLMNQGIHYLDLLRWLLGPVARVFGRCATALHDIEVEDIATASLEFRTGAIGTVQVSTAVYPGLPWRLQLAGSQGTVCVEDGALIRCDLRDGSAPPEPAAPDAGSAGDNPPVHAQHRDQLAEFLAALAAGTDPPVTGQDGRAALELVLAIYESARTGAEVVLDG